MQQRLPQNKQQQAQRIFTASEVAEFEYCPLTWWHQQFEPLAQADTEELFARLVELEHDHGPQAPGRQQHLDHADEVQEIEAERVEVVHSSDRARALGRVAFVLLLVALALIVISALVTLLAR